MKGRVQLYKLVIAEKPSVARSIAAVIGANKNNDGYVEGSGYIVTWCVGHLVGLAYPEAYDEKYAERWCFEQLPIIPDRWIFQVIENTAKQYKIVKELMNDSRIDSIICATDAGREGECIFRYVYNKAGCKKPFQRLWISSMEDKAIREGFANLRDGHDYDAMYASGLCRAKADWLVGINGTRLFTVRHGAMISVGRVQTPTLAMVVKRDHDISHFVKQRYFTVELNMETFKASSEKLNDEPAAEKLKAACDSHKAVVSKVIREIKTVNPPRLYDLTTLQREANRHYGYTAQQTLDYLQLLYEKKLATYPRTDSQFLTDDMEQTATDMIDIIYSVFPDCKVVDFTPDVKRCINNKKVSDHHAVIPTREISTYDLSSLPEGERNILKLIAAKLVLATAPPHKFEAVKAILTCEGNEFSTTGKTVMQDGWKGIEAVIRNGTAAEDKDEKPLPLLTEGMTFDSVSAEKSEHFTTPPKPYTEDTLLKAMETAGNSDHAEDSDVEKKGLGTPATRAAILETLVKRGYIERSKKQILSTEVGRKLIGAVPEMVSSPKLTADWETRLQAIERSELSDTEFMDGITHFINDMCSTFSVKDDSGTFAPKRETLGSCPHCGKEIVSGKFGFYCTGKCGMQIGKVFGKSLTEKQIQTLLGGDEISFTSNGRKTTVLPEVIENNYTTKDGKDIHGFAWKTKSFKKG